MLSPPRVEAQGVEIRHQDEVFQVGTGTPFATYTFQDALVTADLLGSSQTALGRAGGFDFGKIISDITISGMSFHSCFNIKANPTC
jgi:hypothetical protein